MHVNWIRTLVFALFVGAYAGLTVGAQPIRPSPTLVTISLRALEAEVRTALARGNLNVDAMPIRLSEVVGYRWDAVRKDIQVIGPAGDDATSIRVGQLVEALRTGHYDAIGMTLIPADFTRPDSRQRVVVFPKELRDTRLVEPLIAADYEAKRMATDALVTHHRVAFESCLGSPRSSKEVMTARIMFLPADPVLELEDEGAAGFTTRFQADVILRPARDLVLADDVVNVQLPPDAPLAEFATQFTSDFAQLESRYPDFRRLHATYEMVLLANLLRAERVPWASDFWLSEFPLKAHLTPRELPSLQPTRLQHTCWGQPYEYGGARTERQIWGGVIVSYGDWLSRVAHTRAALHRSDLGASVGLSSTTQTTPLSSRRGDLQSFEISRAPELSLVVSISPGVPSSFADLHFSLPPSAVQVLLPSLHLASGMVKPASLPPGLGSNHLSLARIAPAPTSLPSSAPVFGSLARPFDRFGGGFLNPSSPGIVRYPSLWSSGVQPPPRILVPPFPKMPVPPSPKIPVPPLPPLPPPRR